MPLDKEELDQIEQAHLKALRTRDKERAKELEEQREKERAAAWDGKTDRRKDDRRKAAKAKGEEKPVKKVRSIFSKSAA